MADRPWWRRIDLRHLNVALYLALVGIMLRYGAELGWAVSALPAYLRGEIPAPIERSMYLSAAELPPKDAIPLLEQSIAIDPNTEAVHILAKKLVEAGKPDEARKHYQRYLEIDPFVRAAYVELSALLEGQNKRAEALGVLERGAAHFRRNVDRFRPQPDPSVGEPENDKARRVHGEYNESIRVLEAAAARLRARPHP
ncbi:MAG TPA: tetratricopeptide repeat protein [Polyangiaceae bacterium]|nr:tetratricopeptide repeat protein [Polyangiaceae bacterium]HMR75618.1 tetratricopeptide repeat protein [Polyangiaceae bacterium]